MAVVAQAKVTEVTTVVATAPRKDRIISAVNHAQAATLALAKTTQDRIVEIVRHPHFQVVTVSTAGGAVTFGSVGGAFGCMGGVMIGTVTGMLPALLTFGTSIPIGAAVGGGLGASAGVCVGGAGGAAAGGAASHGVYVWRAEIKSGMFRVKKVSEDRVEQLRLSLTDAGDQARSFTVIKTTNARNFIVDRSTKAKNLALDRVKQTREFAVDTKSKGFEVVSDSRVQVTTASALAGAVSCGATGGAVGTVAGAGTGALVGLPAAMFTFGLSVPFCAVVGGGMGCAAGTASGTAAGSVAAGAAGYTIHKHRQEISGRASTAWGRVQNGTNQLKIKAMDSVTHVTAMVSGTGGTTGGAGSE